MGDPPVEKRFRILCEITRAQHFAWREAVVRMAPKLDATEVVKEMWRVTGEGTGAAYAKHLDPKRPLPQQVEIGKDGGEAFVRHRACPWLGWHEKKGLLKEDRPGCDAWFEGTVATLNRELGCKLKVETLKALPDGDDSCLRRFTVEG
jgi:hypothetical protein